MSKIDLVQLPEMSIGIPIAKVEGLLQEPPVLKYTMPFDGSSLRGRRGTDNDLVSPVRSAQSLGDTQTLEGAFSAVSKPRIV